MLKLRQVLQHADERCDCIVGGFIAKFVTAMIHKIGVITLNVST